MRTLLLISLLLVFTACKQNEEIEEYQYPIIENVDQKVNSLLDNWHKAAADGDADTYFGLLKDKSIFIGTQEDEVWEKEAFYNFSKEYFDRGQAWDFKKRYRNIYQKDGGQTVWFDELLDTWMGECRGSGVLSWDSEMNDYFIEHYVLSLTVPNEKINDVIRAIGQVEPRD